MTEQPGRILPVVTVPDQVLRQVCAGLPDDPGRLAADMLASLYAAGGRGLAAPQVGLALRMFVMDVGWKDGAADPLVALDPVLRDPSDEVAERVEGCLSIPDVRVAVTRPAAVTLDWTGLDGQRHSARMEGIRATCVQHEMDHLNGILITDHGEPVA